MSAKRQAEPDIDSSNEKSVKVAKLEKDEQAAGESEACSVAEGDKGSSSNLELETTKVLNEKAGTFLMCGSTNWDLTGRKTVPKGSKPGTGKTLWSPHRYGPLLNTRVRLVVSGPTAAHSVIVTDQGKVLVMGRNEKGQLGIGTTTRVETPVPVDNLADQNIVSAACGRNHTLFLTAEGRVWGAGENKMGQCGVGTQEAIVSKATPLKYSGPPIVKVSCGAEFSLILDCKGRLHSFGCPEYGCLGNNTDGKYFVTNTKLGFQFQNSPQPIVLYVDKTKDGHTTPVKVDDIIDVSCGTNHAVALDKQRRVFSWGWGALGRLGHAEQKDEWIPRLINFFERYRNVKSVHCGNSYSLGISSQGNVYMFGQSKRTGEANMYPKPIQDLSGWNIRSVGCSFTSIVVAADDSVISWGSSPTSGELGYGESMKSSTTPHEVKPLESIYVKEVTCGLGHTMFIARDDSNQERDEISKLPLYDP